MKIISLFTLEAVIMAVIGYFIFGNVQDALLVILVFVLSIPACGLAMFAISFIDSYPIKD